ncbi:MAG: prolyl oligopeptidase family serine peptidase [Woeseia sp.]
MRLRTLIAYGTVASLLACDNAPPVAVAVPVPANDVSLDALYAMPSLIGTAPEQIAWSKDGKNIAFLWNDEGYQDWDIWNFSLATGEKHRLTSHGDDGAGGRTTDAITELRWLNDQEIIYVSDGDIHSLDVADGASTLIAAPEDAASQLNASPDGEYISYVTKAGLWISETGKEATEPRRILKGDEEDVFVESYKWSAHGGKIAFVMADERSARHLDIHYFAQGEEHVNRVTAEYPGDETTKRRIGVLNVADTPETVFDRRDEHDPIWGYEWSPDGNAVLVDTGNLLATNRLIVVYDAKSPTATVYYDVTSPDGPHYPSWSAGWAPDGQGVIVLSDFEGYYHLYLLSEAGSTPAPLTKGEWEVASFTVDHQQSQIYFVANKDHIADRQLYRVPSAPGGNVEEISTASGTYTPFYSPNFEYVAFRFSDDTTPPDLYLRGLAGAGKLLQVTRSPQDAFYEYTWPDIRYVEFKSHVDGSPLVGRLALPADFDPKKLYPLIVGPVYNDTVRNQWGGRPIHPTWGLDEVFVSLGYLVFNVNIRGSWGQGRAFRNGLDEFGSLDIDDIESGIRHLISEGYVDPDRVGIWGASYGGLMTTMSLFKKPGLYAAGVAGAPATNVWHATPQQMRVMGEPKGDDYPERYRRQSSLWQVSGLEDPLMIIHGTRDSIVEYSDTIAFVEELIRNNKTLELVTLPGVNHYWGNDNVEQMRFAYKKMLEFFTRNLAATPND